jgi:hypothetical protein
VRRERFGAAGPGRGCGVRGAHPAWSSGPLTLPLDVRYRRMRGLCWLVVLSISAFAHAADSRSFEGQKIAYLIAAIETLQGAQFIRNGTAYNAKAAADHLRLKLRMAGSRVATADDFIRLCASASSVSGIPYQIRFPDGRVVSSEAYLRQKLAEFNP